VNPFASQVLAQKNYLWEVGVGSAKATAALILEDINK
jgi:hypothetical protein